MKPYYDHGGITIYLGDSQEILPQIKCDVVITDPPYPDIDKGFPHADINLLNSQACHQFVFWSAAEPFPLDWTAVHIWHKPNGNSSHHYERIFERNGKHVYRVYRVAAILPNYTQYKAEATAHPTQKPLKLVHRLVAETAGQIVDPFMGSGTTLRAAKDASRKAIGIEIEERYCEIAAKRLGQEVLPFEKDGMPCL